MTRGWGGAPGWPQCPSPWCSRLHHPPVGRSRGDESFTRPAGAGRVGHVTMRSGRSARDGHARPGSCTAVRATRTNQQPLYGSVACWGPRESRQEGEKRCASECSRPAGSGRQVAEEMGAHPRRQLAHVLPRGLDHGRVGGVRRGSGEAGARLDAGAGRTLCCLEVDLCAREDCVRREAVPTQGDEQPLAQLNRRMDLRLLSQREAAPAIWTQLPQQPPLSLPGLLRSGPSASRLALRAGSPRPREGDGRHRASRTRTGPSGCLSDQVAT